MKLFFINLFLILVYFNSFGQIDSANLYGKWRLERMSYSADYPSEIIFPEEETPSDVLTSDNSPIKIPISGEGFKKVVLVFKKNKSLFLAVFLNGKKTKIECHRYGFFLPASFFSLLGLCENHKEEKWEIVEMTKDTLHIQASSSDCLEIQKYVKSQ